MGFNSLEFPGALVAKSTEISDLLPVLKADDRRLALAAYGDEARLKQDLASDYLFVEPALALAAAHAATGAPTYVYRFDGAPLAIRTSMGGAYHASERAFVFGNPDRAPRRATPAAIQLADRMNRTWSDFAKGKPPLSDWPRFAPDGSVLEWAESGDRVVPASSLAGAAFIEHLRGRP